MADVHRHEARVGGYLVEMGAIVLALCHMVAIGQPQMIAAIHKDVAGGILPVAVENHRYVLELLGLQVIHIESVLLGRNPKVMIPVGGESTGCLPMAR